MALTSLPNLPTLTGINAGLGVPLADPSNGFQAGPPNMQTGIGLPTGGVTTPPILGGSSAPPVAVTSTGWLASFLSLIGGLTSTGGNQLLRIALFLLGLICVIGAIYLFKPTTQIIAAPVNAVKSAAKAGAAVLKAGATAADAAGG